MDTFEKIMHALGDARLAEFSDSTVVGAYPARLVEDVLHDILGKERALCPKCHGEGLVYSKSVKIAIEVFDRCDGDLPQKGFNE